MSILQEASGKTSTMRAISLLLVADVVVLTIIAALNSDITTELIALVTTILGFAIGGKVWQKEKEQ